MRAKQDWQIDGFRRMTRGNVAMIVVLPMRLGADTKVLASVACLDGKAVVIPATTRCGVLVCEWSKWMRYVRRHCIKSIGGVA